MVFTCPKSRFLTSFLAFFFFLAILFYLGFLVFAEDIEELRWVHIMQIIVLMSLTVLSIIWYGYRLKILNEGIFKEWFFWGKTFYSKRITKLGENAVIFRKDILALQNLSSSDLLRSYSEFGPPYMGFSFNRSSPTFIQVSDFNSFSKEVLSRIDHVETDESSVKNAKSMGIDLGNKAKIVEVRSR